MEQNEFERAASPEKVSITFKGNTVHYESHDQMKLLRQADLGVYFGIGIDHLFYLMQPLSNSI